MAVVSGVVAAGFFIFLHARSGSANLPLLLGSILFNWAIARQMMAQTDNSKRKLYLWAGLTVNIIVLFLFKYIHLFLETIAYFHGPHLSFPKWGFPLAVSFFTLTQIMYLVDAYPRAPSSLAARNFSRPDHGQLAVRPRHFCDVLPLCSVWPFSARPPGRPQLRTYSIKEPPSVMLCRGLFLFSMGLAKKVVFGDSFGTIADAGSASTSNYSLVEAWIFSLAALFHLYFDFSGYSDMALGTAWMLGIDIPQNFNAPLRSRSISEFWQRWHISLSNFITEYLYNPLLRSFGTPTLATSAAATIIAMTIAALWHGPAWTFVAWGFSHGMPRRAPGGKDVNQKRRYMANDAAWTAGADIGTKAARKHDTPDDKDDKGGNKYKKKGASGSGGGGNPWSILGLLPNSIWEGLSELALIA